MKRPTFFPVRPGQIAMQSAAVILMLAWLSVLAATTWENVLLDEPVVAHSYRVLAVFCTALALWAMSMLLPSKRLRWIPVFLGAAGIVLINVYFITLRGALTAIFMLALAILVGHFLLQKKEVEIEMKTLVGLAIVAAVVGWLLPFQLHSVRTYFMVAITSMAFLLIRRQTVPSFAPSNMNSWAGRESWPTFLLLASIGLASMGLWLPTVNFDDNAGHLILPSQLASDGYYHLDVSSQMWALAPWLNNVLHAVGAVIAGEEVRTAVNMIWLLFGAFAAYRLTMSLTEDEEFSLLSSAIYLSHPFVTYLSTSMQVDGITAAVFMTLLAYVVRHDGRVESAIILGVLFGFMAGLKSSNVVFAILPLGYICYKNIKLKNYRALFGMFLVAAFVAGSSYFYSYLITGNPFFPLFNEIFKSPYTDSVSFRDGRWHAGVSLFPPWDLTFETDKYGEFYPGAAGLAFIALSFFAIPQAIRIPKFRLVFASALVGGALIFWQVQYLRYLFPAIAVLTTLGLIGARRFLPKPFFIAATLLLLIANFVLMPTTSWMMRSDPWTKLLAQGVDEKSVIEKSLMPEKAALLAIVNQDPEACVLLADPATPYVGSAANNAFAMAWYDKRLSSARAAAQEDATGSTWASTIRALGVSHVIVNSEQQKSIIAGLRKIGFRTINRTGHLEVWAMPDPRDRVCYSKVKEHRDEARRLLRLEAKQ